MRTYSKEGEREILRLLIPVETKRMIKLLAQAKSTTMNNIGNQLIEGQLGPNKTDLVTVIANSVSQFRPVEEIVANHRQVISSFTCLSLIPTTQRDKFLQKGERFIQTSRNFVHSLQTDQGYEV